MAYHTIVKGDADAAMAGAEVVVKSHYRSDASQGVPIEPRAVVAQWQGDKVTVWSSTQVPYAARAGVAQTLEVPEADVRIIVPLLGGGFGAKCDLHFEGQVAALARAAQRPVRLVFSREEEFKAIAQRREGISMDFETGVTRDGKIVARRATLILDKGAYCGEGGFLGQMAAMHACGPYQIDAIKIESHLNYTNNQPSGSVRAPTAPQVCWGLEQHMDEVAAAIGMDPVDLRRRTLIEEGAEGPTRQVFEHVGVKDTLEKAVEMIDYGHELPEDEAIGVAIGWWPCMPAASGAYVQMNGDGSATIVTGAQENGSGAVMAMPMFVAQELGIDPNDVSVIYQDTDVAPWDMGSCGSQTTFNSGRAILAAAQEVREQLLDAAAEQLEADRGDLELIEGNARVKGSPERSVAVADLVGEIGTVHGKGSGEVLDAPTGDTGGCVGRLGNETFLAPQLITQAAHVKVDRETGVVRVLAGRRRARLGPDPQQERRGRPGVRRGRDGCGPRAVGGHDARRPRPSAEPAPPRLQARHLLRHSPDRRRVDRVRLGRAARLQGSRRATAGADRRRDRQRDREGDRFPRRGASDDPGARMARDPREGRMSPSFTSASTLDDALAAVASGARPVAGGTDLVVGARQGKAPLPEDIVAIDRVDGLRALEVSDAGLRLGTLVTHGDIVANADIRTRFTSLADASAIVGSHATRAQGTIGRQRDERVAGDGHRRPAPVLRRDGDPPLGGGGADDRARRPVDRTGQDVGRAR
jgi:hypothetical protein